jgi:hypothetical protein
VYRLLEDENETPVKVAEGFRITVPLCADINGEVFKW